MTPLLTPSRIEALFWGLLCGGLVATIALETDFGQRWQAPLAVAEAESGTYQPPPLAEPFRLPTADTFLEVAMRPVLVVSRRPPPPAPLPEAPKPTMKRDQFALTGVTVVAEGKFAFLFEKATNKTRVVKEGKEVNGLLVKEVRPDRVVLSQYDETELLVLKTAKGPAQANAVAPTPAATAAPQPGRQPRTAPNPAPAVSAPQHTEPLIGPPPIEP